MNHYSLKIDITNFYSLSKFPAFIIIIIIIIIIKQSDCEAPSPRPLVNVKYSFTVITPKSSLTLGGVTS